MRAIALSFLSALLLISQAAAQTDPAAPKEAVTVEVDADLLQRARALNMDLGAFLEAQLAAVLPATAQAPVAGAVTHASVVASAFNTFEDLAYAPLKIDQNTSVAEVKATCQFVIDKLGQFVAQAETRKSMAQPTTLEEVTALNQYIAGRFKALEIRMGEVGQQVQDSGKILEEACPELDQNEQVATDAMNTALGVYTAEGWCRAMMRKPQSAWTMEDGGNFAKACQGAKLN